MNAHAPIQDHAQYNAEMAKSLPEKLFFLDKVKADVWVDFGCGDGSVLGAIRRTYPVEAFLLGIESDPRQAAFARDYGWVFPDFHGVRNTLNDVYWQRATTAAIFSSVLHESPELLYQAIDFGFDYIIIRDMALLDTWRDQEQSLLAAFKLPYWNTPSWEREANEDYFQLDAGRFFVDSPTSDYRTVYFEHSAVPAIQDRIERDIGIRPEAPTHVKAIWKKVK